MNEEKKETPDTTEALAKASVYTEETGIGFQSQASFALLQRAAQMLSSSTIVPDTFKNNPPNCALALNMAQRMDADPLMVVQNLYVVHGRPSWSAKFLIATFNQSPKYNPIKYEWKGTRGKDDWGCKAYAVIKASGDTLYGPTIDIALAKAEGWYDKSGSKWKTIPELMLMYRAAAWFINTHAPEIAMGLRTFEEEEDVIIDVTPEPSAIERETATKTEALKEKIGAKKAKAAEPVTEPAPPPAPAEEEQPPAPQSPLPEPDYEQKLQNLHNGVTAMLFEEPAAETEDRLINDDEIKNLRALLKTKANGDKVKEDKIAKATRQKFVELGASSAKMLSKIAYDKIIAWANDLKV